MEKERDKESPDGSKVTEGELVVKAPIALGLPALGRLVRLQPVLQGLIDACLPTFAGGTETFQD